MSLKLNSSGGGSVTLQEPVTASTLTLNLPAFSGTAATLATVTNNGVLYVNSSGQPTSGSALTFDGSKFGVGGTSVGYQSTDAAATIYGGANGSALRLTNATTGNALGTGGGLFYQLGLDTYLYNASAGPLIFGVSNSEQMRLTSTGLGIGTSSPTAKLDVYREMRVTQGLAEYRFRITNTDGNARLLVDGDTSALIFGTSGAGSGATATERMRIDPSGNLLVGTTSNSTGANISSSRGLGTTNAATGRFATIEYGSGAFGTYTTITVSFTVNSSTSSVILEVLMTGFASVYLDHVAARYSNQTAVVMRNSASAGTTVASLAVDGAGLVYTLTITTSVTHPVVKVKATVGGLGSTTTLPTIAFA